MKDDKIFNNRFNSGDLEYEVFGTIKLHDETTAGDIYEEYIEDKMQKDLYDIFIASPYYEEYVKNRKVSKNNVSTIYYYFEERLPGHEGMTAIDKFTHIAEFMCIPYEILYTEIGPAYKEKILRELDSKYQVFKRHKIKQLF